MQTFWKRVRWFIAFVLLVIVAITIVQNTGVVSLRFFVWETQVSRALLLPTILVAGFALGVLAGLLRLWPRRDRHDHKWGS